MFEHQSFFGMGRENDIIYPSAFHCFGAFGRETVGWADCVRMVITTNGVRTFIIVFFSAGDLEFHLPNKRVIINLLVIKRIYAAEGRLPKCLPIKVLP